jgi:chorismate mutase
MVAVKVRAIRGATTLDHDEQEHLHERTQELVDAMLTENTLSIDDLISVFFTCTPDIVSDFPAAAARQMGLGAVPLMCAQEMDVPGALPRVVRVMVHAHMDTPRADVVHVYLHEATSLRRDLAQ